MSLVFRVLTGRLGPTTLTGHGTYGRLETQITQSSSIDSPFGSVVANHFRRVDHLRKLYTSSVTFYF